MESIIAFSASCFLVFLLLALFSQKINLTPQNRVLRSLARLSPTKESDKNQEDTRKVRLQLFFHHCLNNLSKVKQNNKRSKNDLALTSAGLTNWSYAEWRILNYVAGIFCGLLAIVFCFSLSFTTVQIVEITMVCFFIGLFFPTYWLKQRTRQRKEEIDRNLPDVLDLIMVSIEAGLGFDAALLKVVEKQNSVLAQEFNLVLQEIKMGRPRREALKEMAKKNNVDALSNVIASLVQADQLGISMGNVLRNQSKQIRQNRRQRAQEQAQKAPVKIMIPLVFFIFPSIFIVILGPACIQIMEVFSK